MRRIQHTGISQKRGKSGQIQRKRDGNITEGILNGKDLLNTSSEVFFVIN